MDTLMMQAWRAVEEHGRAVNEYVRLQRAGSPLAAGMAVRVDETYVRASEIVSRVTDLGFRSPKALV